MNDGRRSELISKAEIVSAPYFHVSVAFPPPVKWILSSIRPRVEERDGEVKEPGCYI